MPRPMRPWTFFLAAIAGWMNRRQQEVIEFLKEESRTRSSARLMPLENSLLMALYSGFSEGSRVRERTRRMKALPAMLRRKPLRWRREGA